MILFPDERTAIIPNASEAMLKGILNASMNGDTLSNIQIKGLIANRQAYKLTHQIGHSLALREDVMVTN